MRNRRRDAIVRGSLDHAGEGSETIQWKNPGAHPDTDREVVSLCGGRIYIVRYVEGWHQYEDDGFASPIRIDCWAEMPKGPAPKEST